VREITIRTEGRCRYCKLPVRPGSKAKWEPGMGVLHPECEPLHERRQARRGAVAQTDFTLER